MRRLTRPSRAAAGWRRLGPVAALGLAVVVVACGGEGPTGGGVPGGDDDAGSATSTTAAGSAAGCSPTRPAEATGEPQVFTHDGQEREYLLELPDDGGDGGDGTTPRPLVLSLHGFGNDMVRHEENTAMGRQGSDRGYVVVTPQALGDPARWNFDRRPDGPDDYGFVLALVADLQRRLCIDADRTYVAGSSNGAAFSGFLACEEPDLFAAVAMVIATVPSTCPADVTPSRISIRGTADRTPEATTMFEGDAQRHGCSVPPQTESLDESVERLTYRGCAGDAELVLVTVEGGEHVWFGSPQADRPSNSPAGRTFPTTDTILDFFTRHPA